MRVTTGAPGSTPRPWSIPVGTVPPGERRSGSEVATAAGDRGRGRSARRVGEGDAERHGGRVDLEPGPGGALLHVADVRGPDLAGAGTDDPAAHVDLELLPDLDRAVVADPAVPVREQRVVAGPEHGDHRVADRRGGPDERGQRDLGAGRADDVLEDRVGVLPERVRD